MTNYIEPQSASSPFTTNLRKDELAALQTVEQGATAAQRIAATGNSVPLVFAKFENGSGGAWASPPAARYGAEVNPNAGEYYAFGMVVSDGQISPIADADIWKGAVQANTLSEYAAVNAYGSMPSAGFNYTLTSVDPNTPTKSERFDVEEATSLRATSGSTGTVTIQNCARFSYSNMKVGAGPSTYFSTWKAYVNGVLYESSGTVQQSSWPSKSFSFDSPVTFSFVVSTIFADYWKGAPINFTNLKYTYYVITPEIPGAVSGLPLFPGSGGSFAGMSTLAVKGRYSADADSGMYKQQVRCFVRNGVIVDKVLGGTGSSSSFPDLMYYLLRQTSKVSAQLIDLPSLQVASQFASAMGMRFNGVLANSVNLHEYLGRIAPFFLLRFVQINGKFGLKPALPIRDDYTVSSDPVKPVASFDDSNIVAGSYQKKYEPLSKRREFCALMTWRAQTETSYGVPKVTEVRFANTAIDGPFEQYDMEEFCASEGHAILIGKYIVSSRKHITHSISFQTIELTASLQPASLIRVTWDYEALPSGGDSTSLMYQVDAVTEGANGVLRVDATHFPLTANGASQVAVDVLSSI